MACNSCHSKFSFFTREKGCSNCGFSYCKRCLRYKCQLSSDNFRRICGPCYYKSKPISKGVPIEVPDELPSNIVSSGSVVSGDLQHKIDSSNSHVKSSIDTSKREYWEKFKIGLDRDDQLIIDRWRKLKNEDNELASPTNEDICRRLKSLRNRNPDNAIKMNMIYKVNMASNHEESEALIEHYTETMKFSPRTRATENTKLWYDPSNGIHQPESSTSFDSDGDNNEAITMRIIEKAIAEATLEAKYDDEICEEMNFKVIEDHQGDESSCVMCEKTENLVQCKGCTGDLYCTICFEDNHDDVEKKKQHKTVPYRN